MRGALIRQTPTALDPRPPQPPALTPLESILTETNPAISFRMNTYENDGAGVSPRLFRSLFLHSFHSCARKSFFCHSYENTRGYTPPVRSNHGEDSDA